MLILRKPHSFAVGAALASLFWLQANPLLRAAQAPPSSAESELAAVPLPDPPANALPLPEDRGQADLEQTLKRLGTTASVLYIVAHPDDEDGSLLTYLSRGLGARVTLLTLNRGEGGQNAMSAEEDDALGLIRTNELLKADEYYGVKQLWGTEYDFGFSKTQEESFARWGHDRVLYDAVLAVRKVRPQVIVATFVGAVSDGHGQHQVSGEIAQEAFKAAADPHVFPDQFKDGVAPWQPLAVYSRAPFAAVTDKGIFDYATGKWAPARFRNYVTGEWIQGRLSTDVSIPVGTWDPTLGRTYVQIAREGWGEQKSQYGGASPALSGPDLSAYHLWAVAPAAGADRGASGGREDTSLFQNDKVHIDTSLEGLARFVSGAPPAWLTGSLNQIETSLSAFESDCHNEAGINAAHQLAPIYRQTLDLYTRVKASDLDAEAKTGLELELSAKISQFQRAFDDLLGLDLIAFSTRAGGGQGGGSARGGTADETPRSVAPGEDFEVRVHTAQADGTAGLSRVWLASDDGPPWKIDDLNRSGAQPASARVADRRFRIQVPEDARPTEAYFTRPSAEQPYYNISNPAWRLRSFEPWPLAAWAEFTFDGVPIRIGKVVQTLQRVTGPGGVYEPLVVTPEIGVQVEPAARILPLDGSALPVKVIVHAQSAAEGTIELKLPEGWHADPARQEFHLKSAGDSAPLAFSVTTPTVGVGSYSIQVVAQSGGRSYTAGWQSIGYPGLRPYNLYKPATLETRKVDVKLAPGLRVGYIMGTGDLVPEAIAELGAQPHLLSDQELASADLSQWNLLMVGIRAYSTRPALGAAQQRLEDYVERGGTLVVQYQSDTFPAPLPLAIGRTPERVVDEQAPVKLLDPSNPLLSWPNRITPGDFDGWVEERGHSFLDSWDPGYTPLTETADPGQDPQRGGLLVAHPGKGTYIYIAYALYRQLPELVPGSYRLLANLLSAGKQGSEARSAHF
ncbi:MAG TPA: PIG-L family deacetylase [Terracidiphilus sp.]|jgi:LmbE family N-acetylglucosaminyl deacetylase